MQEINYCKTDDDCFVVGEYSASPSSDLISNPIRELDPDIGISIKLPNDENHMIVGIWWQHEYSSTTAGYIHNIEKFMWKDSSDWREMDMTSFFDGFLWDGENQAADKRKEIAYLERPIYTNEVRLMGIKYTAQPWNNWFPKGTGTKEVVDKGEYVPYNLGHDLYVQLELFGCPNYDMSQCKLYIFEGYTTSKDNIVIHEMR